MTGVPILFDEMNVPAAGDIRRAAPPSPTTTFVLSPEDGQAGRGAARTQPANADSAPDTDSRPRTSLERLAVTWRIRHRSEIPRCLWQIGMLGQCVDDQLDTRWADCPVVAIRDRFGSGGRSERHATTTESVLGMHVRHRYTRKVGAGVDSTHGGPGSRSNDQNLWILGGAPSRKMICNEPKF